MLDFNSFDDLFEPVIIEDQLGKIVYFNASLLSLLKVTPRYFKKQDDAEQFFKEVIPNFLNNYYELKGNQQVLSSEISFNLDDTKVVVVIKGIKSEDLCVYFFKDMTVENLLYEKYKDQVEELKNSHSQIIQSDKLKVIGEMTANISHEINNPLTVAMGNSEMIEFTLESEDLNKHKKELVKFNSNISNSIGRITKIISNMKEFLHNSEEQKEYYSIKEILEKSVSFLNPVFTKNNVKFTVISTDEAPIIFANKIKMEQVFVNLFQNAIDAMVDAKTLNPEIKIKLHSLELDGHIAIDIYDNGPGVKEEVREKIFNTFFTTKEIGRGTGLGLSISNRIIESHQGKLELLESKHGALFRISLPSVSVSSYVSGDWEKMYSNSGNFKKVLVVDNDPNILNLCMSFFKNSDFYFLGATSASEALAQMDRISVDVIITDLKMPNTNGEELVRSIRKKYEKVPIFYMTSKDNIDQFTKIKDELILSGMIIKPFTKIELIQTVESLEYDKE